MLSWSSNKQQHIADSSCYAEYIALHEASHELIFMRQLLDSLGFSMNQPTTLHCDNEAACQISKDQHWHKRTRHFCIKYHSICDLIDEDELHINMVPSINNTADILMKALTCPHFEHLRNYLGVRPHVLHEEES